MPVVRRDQVLGPVQETQPVLGAALLGFPFRQDPEQPGGQGVVHLVQVYRSACSCATPAARSVCSATHASITTGTE